MTRQTGNGFHDHYPAAEAPSFWRQQFTGGKVFLGCWSLVLVLISTGWLMIPAKESDLLAVAAEVAALRTDIKDMAGDVREIRTETQRTREEVIRLSAGILSQIAPLPIARKKKAAPKPGGFQALIE